MDLREEVPVVLQKNFLVRILEKVAVELPGKAIPSAISRGVAGETFRKVADGILRRFSRRSSREISACICGGTSNRIL